MKWLPSLKTIATAVMLAAGGCQSHSQPTLLHGENFVPDDQPHTVDNVAAVQAARGARSSATLYPAHFNDAGLNSLGRQKLESMLQDEEAAPAMVVYLDFPARVDPAPAHQAVAEFLKARGLAESQIKVIDGPNPDASQAATDALTGQAALQQTQPPGGGAVPGYAPPQSTGAATPAGPTDNRNH